MTIPPAFHVTAEHRDGPWLITCDHASNRVPDELPENLGLPPEDMARHIAFDIGARGVALALGAALNGPVIESDFSRLVIDPNRGEDDPTLVMKLYDGSLIAANRQVDAAEIERRLTAYHRPYHTAYERLAARRSDTVICAVHSFTPQFKGRPRRPWQIGILSAEDKRLTDPLIAALRDSPSLKAEAARLGEPLVIGDNEPYRGDLPGDAIDTHAIAQGRLNVLLELRSDLIETPEDQQKWAALLAPIFKQVHEDITRAPKAKQE